MLLDANFVHELYNEFKDRYEAATGLPMRIPLRLEREPGEVREGFHAEFYEDGQLAHFGYYRNGRRDGKWSLYLDREAARGRAQRVTQECFPEDVNDGRWISSADFKAARQAERACFEQWVSDWVRRVCDEPSPVCSFCERHQYEVKQMVAGANGYICDECVQGCVDFLARSGRRSA